MQRSGFSTWGSTSWSCWTGSQVRHQEDVDKWRTHRDRTWWFYRVNSIPGRKASYQRKHSNSKQCSSWTNCMGLERVEKENLRIFNLVESDTWFAKILLGLSVQTWYIVSLTAHSTCRSSDLALSRCLFCLCRFASLMGDHINGQLPSDWVFPKWIYNKEPSSNVLKLSDDVVNMPLSPGQTGSWKCFVTWNPSRSRFHSKGGGVTVMAENGIANVTHYHQSNYILMPSLAAAQTANAAFSSTYRPVALFVGGTSGIGQGTAERFAHHSKGRHILLDITTFTHAIT